MAKLRHETKENHLTCHFKLLKRTVSKKLLTSRNMKISFPLLISCILLISFCCVLGKRVKTECEKKGGKCQGKYKATILKYTSLIFEYIKLIVFPDGGCYTRHQDQLGFVRDFGCKRWCCKSRGVWKAWFGQWPPSKTVKRQITRKNNQRYLV